MKQHKELIRGALFGALAVLLIIGAVSCGTNLSGAGNAAKETTQTGSKEDGRLESAETKLDVIDQLIEENYLGDKDEGDLTEGLYKGYVEALGDPYSVYYDEEETKALWEDTSGEFGGIGALLSQNIDSGVVTIIKVYPDSPAEKAGIQMNDILYQVDGIEVTGLELSEVITYIRGDEGTTVDLTVLRGEDAEEIELTATREIIESETVTDEMLEGEIGYIQISEFDALTYDQYQEAMEDLENQGMKGLVVDLRNNPGGTLDTVTKILDLMLPKGTVVSVKDKSGEEEEYTSDDEHQFTKPLAVLVNGNSASASEIYAGAIQDYGTGEIVGTQSYGKGVVQQIFDLEDGTALKLTIAEYFTPDGRNINGEGITPDVEVEYELNEEDPEYDNQLEKAIEVIENQ